jgi:hypothetical protein
VGKIARAILATEEKWKAPDRESAAMLLRNSQEIEHGAPGEL